MTEKTIVVIGASRLGCQMALAANAKGYTTVLVDEHPQGLKGMSFDAPYFYGSGLPAALADEAASLDNVLSANELLMECIDREIDVRIGTVAWGAFHNSANRQHIGRPNVGLISKDGNELLDYDALVLATGSRDFVPSFAGWDLPGVFGGKAGLQLLEAYQVSVGARVLILGTTPLAVAFARVAHEKGIKIAGLVEPGNEPRATQEDAQWLHASGIPVLARQIILSANGTGKVTSATLRNIATGVATDVTCDSICVAIAAMPNVELPSAMGCDMVFSDDLASWIPSVSETRETSVPHVYWLSSHSGQAAQVDHVLAGIAGSAIEPEPSSAAPAGGAEARRWVAELHRTGGADVVLCQCESVTRGELLDMKPPRYLAADLHQPKSHLSDAPEGARVNQDLAKRMTRVGMGHCQGKRCRDEAAMLLAERYGIGMQQIKPGSYRFPVRPLDMNLIAAAEGDRYTPGTWQHWPEPKVEAGE